MQLATELEGHAISLHREALSSIILSLGGTKATGIVKFLLDSFGGSEAYEDAKRQILAHAPLPKDLEEGLLDDDEEEEQETSSTTSANLKDICPLSKAKPFFPTPNLPISTTGVPSSFLSDNMPEGPTHQSCYHCLFEECGFRGHQKDTTCTHIRRKHLGHVVECLKCVPGKARWWSSRSFLPHMKKAHPGVKEDDYWTPLPNVDEVEAAEAAKAVAALTLPTTAKYMPKI